MPQHFNVRVYAIVRNAAQEILVSDEHRYGKSFTKFPGGGLEFGEGLKDALVREFMEEFQLSISVGELFYVNDFVQISAFDPESQIISFYFHAIIDEQQIVQTAKEYVALEADGERLRWIHPSSINATTMTFPIDKHVIQRLHELHQTF